MLICDGEYFHNGNGKVIDNIMFDNNEMERVNFGDPLSIIHYGSKLLEEMSQFTSSVSAMSDTNADDNIDLDRVFEKINNFGLYLDSPTKTDKVKLIPMMKKKAIALKNKLFGSEDMTVGYAEQYAMLSEQIDAIRQMVEQKKNEILNDINIDKAFVEHINIYIEKLEELIRIGQEDLDEYKKAIQSTSIDSSDEAMKLANGKIQLFESRIESLKKYLVVAKNLVLETHMKIQTNMSLFLQYKEYNESTIHVLSTQAKSMITTKSQREKARSLQKLNDVTNDAIKKNSAQVVENVEIVGKMMSQGNIQIDTLEQLSADVKKGIELLKEGRKMIACSRRKEDTVISGLLGEVDALSLETDGASKEAAYQLVKRKPNA